MRITTLLVVPFALCTLLAAACSTASSQPTSTPVPAPTWPVQTGTAPVDGFLNLIAAGELQTIKDHAAWQPLECQPDRLVQDAALYCEELPAGVTTVDAIVVGCFPFWAVLKDDLPESIDWLADDAMELEAVHRTQVGYALTFIEHSDPPAPAVSRSVVYLTDDGRLDSYALCGEFTEAVGVVTQLWP